MNKLQFWHMGFENGAGDRVLFLNIPLFLRLKFYFLPRESQFKDYIETKVIWDHKNWARCLLKTLTEKYFGEEMGSFGNF